MTLFPQPEEVTAGLLADHRARLANWDRLLPVRDQVLKSLDTAREEKLIGASLEARVHLSANDDLYPLLAEYATELPALFIVSQVSLEQTAGDSLSIRVERAQGQKCERCWKYTTDIGSSAAFPTVCGPCAAALSDIFEGGK